MYLAVRIDALCYSALVGDNHQSKTGLFEKIQGLRHTGQDFKITYAVGIVWIVAVKYAIAIEKDATTHSAKMQSSDVPSNTAFWGFYYI